MPWCKNQVLLELVSMWVLSSKPLFDSLLKIGYIKWQRVLEDPRIMRSILQKVLLVILDKLRKEHCISVYLFCKQVRRLVQKSGMLATCLYLKQCSSSLQIAYGGVKEKHRLLPVPVSLSRSGYPRMIPSFHRLMIYKKDDRADQLVQMYLSFFALCKIIELAKKVSYKNTFKSITAPTDLEAVSEWCGELRDHLRSFILRYLPFSLAIPLEQGFSWVPTWKTLPTHARVKQLFKEPLKKMGITRLSSPFPAILFEMNAFSFLLERVHVSQDHFSQGCLWHAYTRYALDSNNRSITNWCLDRFEKVTGPQLPSYHEIGEPPVCGRLGMSIEGGGKRRIFSMGNYLNQRLLRPVHDWLMAVLSRIQMDGTFFQERPLDRLVGEQILYSFDLSAATDRFPLQVSFEIMQALFDRSYASSIRSALALNIFEVPFVKRSKQGVPAAVCFVAGQPLGYYSSWPLFALSHHFLVWWCAEQVYPGVRFTKYALLGDDIVIADLSVALVYKQTMLRLGVSISETKSLISHSGVAEFAKRLRVRGVSKDISPVSPKAILKFFNPFGLITIMFKYNCKRVSTLARIGGAGYKQLGKIDHEQSLRVKRLMVLHTKALFTGQFILLWLGRGQRISPYIEGLLREFLLRKLAPPKLSTMPSELYVAPKVGEFEEYGTLRGWVKLWCIYTKWYYCVALDPWTPFGVLLDPPFCPSHWNGPDEDELIVRFGYVWKMYDWVNSGKLEGVPLALSTSGSEQSDSWILGGTLGNSFLVRARGLIQPCARVGLVLPGVLLLQDRINPKLKLIKYKTLGVSDRQSLLDFDRSRRKS